MLIGGPLLRRLDAHDQSILLRCTSAGAGRRYWRASWNAIAHLGGATATVLATLLPMLAGGGAAEAARDALLSLVVGHLLVQLLKRTIARPRPSRRLSHAVLADEPDRFSFPSGHAAAAMSVACVYAAHVPDVAAPLYAIALLVGASRVFLGVHYVGDVLVGQLLAAAVGTTILRL